MGEKIKEYINQEKIKDRIETCFECNENTTFKCGRWKRIDKNSIMLIYKCSKCGSRKRSIRK